MSEEKQYDEAKIQELKDEYIDHMMNPRNYGRMENEDALGVGKNPFNNELVNLYLKVDRDTIKDIKFECIGCMSTVVTGSIFTDMIKGETLQEALDVANEFIANLDNVPLEQRACGEMVAKAYLASYENLMHRRAGNSDEKEYILEISNDCYPQEELPNE
jgi:nitrogen fixation NifU-like protein